MLSLYRMFAHTLRKREFDLSCFVCFFLPLLGNRTPHLIVGVQFFKQEVEVGIAFSEYKEPVT